MESSLPTMTVQEIILFCEETKDLAILLLYKLRHGEDTDRIFNLLKNKIDKFNETYIGTDENGEEILSEDYPTYLLQHKTADKWFSFLKDFVEEEFGVDGLIDDCKTLISECNALIITLS